MNMIYNSEQYSVVEFGVDRELEALRFGGFDPPHQIVRKARECPCKRLAALAVL